METLSPFTRRLLAIGLLLICLLMAANLVIIPGWQAFTVSLERLRDARYQRTQVEAIAARPPPRRRALTPPDLYVAAPSREVALNELIQQVRKAAVAAELSPSAINAPPNNSSNNLVSIDVVIEGKEPALIGWLAQIEQEPPLKRVAAMRLARSTAPQQVGSATAKPHSLLRLEATVVSAWGRQ